MTDNHPACRRLVAAVLIQGISDYYQHRTWLAMSKKKQAGRHPPAAVFQAEHWILERSNRHMSFDWICAILGIDADAIRDKIRRPGTYAQFRELSNIMARAKNGPAGRPMGRTGL